MNLCDPKNEFKTNCVVKQHHQYLDIRSKRYEIPQFLVHTIRFEQILKTCSEDSEKLGKGLFNYNLSSESLKNTFTGLKYPQNCLLFLPTSFSDNHGQKPWDTFAFLGGFPIHTGPTLPSPHKQCCTWPLQKSVQVLGKARAIPHSLITFQYPRQNIILCTVICIY